MGQDISKLYKIKQTPAALQLERRLWEPARSEWGLPRCCAPWKAAGRDVGLSTLGETFGEDDTARWALSFHIH